MAKSGPPRRSPLGLGVRGCELRRDANATRLFLCRFPGACHVQKGPLAGAAEELSLWPRRFARVDNERAKVCRSKAAECERRAALATDPHIRTCYMNLAHQWREMAEQAEYLDRRYAARRL